MTRRWRITAVTAITLAVIAGIVCLIVVPGDTGALLAVVLMGGSLGAGMLLLFLEVGLSEERERASEERERAAEERRRSKPRPEHVHPPRLRPMTRRPRRIGR